MFSDAVAFIHSNTIHFGSWAQCYSRHTLSCHRKHEYAFDDAIWKWICFECSLNEINRAGGRKCCSVFKLHYYCCHHNYDTSALFGPFSSLRNHSTWIFIANIIFRTSNADFACISLWAKCNIKSLRCWWFHCIYRSMHFILSISFQIFLHFTWAT